MTGKDMRAYRARHEITQSDLAKYLGVARNTISRWELGGYKIDHAIEFLLAGTVWDNGVGTARFEEREGNP